MASIDYTRWNITPDLEQKMRDVARNLRRESTATEVILWERLRNKQLGYKIRRQVPIGPFVIDFLCASAFLAIEVDGSIHAQQQEADAERQALLETLGLRFIRISTRDVENNLSAAVNRIQQALAEKF